MSIDDLAGRTYGPFPYRTCVEKVAEYVSATGDDPGRWTEEAPPSLAGAMLFVVAPHLLGDPDAATPARSVVHGEQTFAWSRPIPIEEELAVSGAVTRVRTRGEVAYVGFDLAVEDAGGPLLSGTSLFLMSAAGSPAGAVEEEPEPAPEDTGDRGGADTGGAARRSVSRAGLVRYAAAARDWNPIHWDHRAAVEAGLPGVVVHGLLQSAWMLQAVPSSRLTEARFRYRSPLRPGVVVDLMTEVGDDAATVSLVGPGGTVVVTGTFRVS